MRADRPATARPRRPYRPTCASASLLFVALALAVALSASAVAAEANTGARIYARTCSVCHGDDGGGAVWARQSLRPAPRNFRTAEAKNELTRARIYAAIMGGRPGTAMMSFATQLSAADVAAVATHIETTFLGRKPPKGGDVVPTGEAAAYPAGVRSDLDWGRRFYVSNCATCHGERGDGRGPRAYFISPPPRNFLDPATTRFDRAALFDAVSNGRVGTEMPAWRQVLTPQEIASVSEYVYAEFLSRRPAAGR